MKVPPQTFKEVVMVQSFQGLVVRGHRLPQSFALNETLRALAIALALLSGSAACTHAPMAPPESPLKQATKDNRQESGAEKDLERRHLAPPPAYGNKIVLAVEEEPTAKQVRL